MNLKLLSFVLLVFSYLECLIELEPVLRTFEDITFLEAVIQLKKTKVNLLLTFCNLEL